MEFDLLPTEWPQVPHASLSSTRAPPIHHASTRPLSGVQVLGFDDPIKISKRVHFESVSTRPARQSEATVMRPILRPSLPESCADAAQIGGIEFEAHIPLSQAALAQMHGLS
jgi:hypothetical protein